MQDIREAFIWYEEQKQHLGFGFLEAIEECYEKLSLQPNHYGYVNERYRRIKTNRFPYLLVYEIEQNNVIINSVRHIKRSPNTTENPD